MFYIGIGIAFFIIGLSATIFKKYPSKKKNIELLESKYGKIDANMLAICEGIFYLSSGALFFIIGIFDILKYNVLLYVFIGLLIIEIILYFPARKKFLNIKD